MSASPELVRQEAVVTRDQILRQRAEKQRVLRGTQQAVLHDEAVAVHAQRDLLTLRFRRESIVHDSQIVHMHIIGADGQRPGAEGVVLPPQLIRLARIVVKDKNALIGPLALQRQPRRPQHKLLTVDAGSKTDSAACRRAVEGGLEIIVRAERQCRHGSSPYTI